MLTNVINNIQHVFSLTRFPNLSSVVFNKLLSLCAVMCCLQLLVNNLSNALKWFEIIFDAFWRLLSARPHWPRHLLANDVIIKAIIWMLAMLDMVGLGWISSFELLNAFECNININTHKYNKNEILYKFLI